MYQSLTMGNIVDTKLEVISQVFESLYGAYSLLMWDKDDHDTCYEVMKIFN